jgi:WhiB family redox-sensing transcriptional regulator
MVPDGIYSDRRIGFPPNHPAVPDNSRGVHVSNLASTLALAAADDVWRDHALCRDTDPELFFPVGTTGQALVSQDQAKQVCQQCTVQQACLDYALDTNQDSGIWGGLTEEERRSIRRKRAAAARAARQAS